MCIVERGTVVYESSSEKPYVHPRRHAHDILHSHTPTPRVAVSAQRHLLRLESSVVFFEQTASPAAVLQPSSDGAHPNPPTPLVSAQSVFTCPWSAAPFSLRSIAPRQVVAVVQYFSRFSYCSISRHG